MSAMKDNVGVVKLFSYRIIDKVFFYFSYFWYKLIIPFEVRSPRFSLWRYEFVYTAHKFFNYEYCLPWRFSTNLIVTRFGSFEIRHNTADAANVSPAFERRDLNRLIKVISSLGKMNQKVLFLDVGGDIGTYSIAIGNRFSSQEVDIICFEPIPDSAQLVRNNIKRNQRDNNVELMELALMDKQEDKLRICLNTMAPGSSSVKGEGEEVFVKADRLDNLLKLRADKYDAIVLKIDVEGVEENVLRGASDLLNRGIKTHLMVEDFIDTSIIKYLENEGWVFKGKYTEYNSWWQKN